MTHYISNHIELTVCIISFIIFLTTFFHYLISIHFEKKQALLKNKVLPEKTASYIGSIVLSFFVELLPFLIHLRLFVLAVICGCGILGEIVVFKDRINAIRG